MKPSEIISELVKEPEQELRRLAFIVDAFDSTDNAVSIYDKNACLVYANAAYLKNMRLKDLKTLMGMNILDITKQCGIKIHAMKTDSNRLKMFDVMRTGKKMLDWEVGITAESSSNSMQLISYNMYPIKDFAGRVQGLIEISSTQQVSLASTKKIMGLSAEYTFDSIIGNSPALQNAVKQAKEYAASPYGLLIVGESGVGKELFSQAVHNESDRANGPFVAINCANFSENLIESELFGYVGGAFTGASKNGQIGKFELADGGTLFLDEIGELPYHFQSKLLRVLETHQVTRIGSNKPTLVNVRIIAATNRNLRKMLDEGLFRKDLYYRLQVLTVEIPPLRERLADIIDLSESFLEQAAEVSGSEVKKLSLSAKQSLLEYSWPGNIRELKNVIQRAAILSKGNEIDEEILREAIYSKGYAIGAGGGISCGGSEAEAGGNKADGNYNSTGNSGAAESEAAGGIGGDGGDGGNLEDVNSPDAAGDGSAGTCLNAGEEKGSHNLSKSTLDEKKAEVEKARKALLEEALRLAGGNKTKASELLGITRQTIYRLMKKYSLSDNK